MNLYPFMYDCTQFWQPPNRAVIGTDYLSVLEHVNKPAKTHICCCFSACLFLTDWHSSVRRIPNITPYVHTYEPVLNAVSYDKHTDIHTRNIIYRTHDNLPNIGHCIFSPSWPFIFVSLVKNCFSDLCVNPDGRCCFDSDDFSKIPHVEPGWLLAFCTGSI